MRLLMVRFFSYIYAITRPKPTPKFPVNSLQLELLGTARDLFDWDEPSIAPSYIVSGHLTHELKSMLAVCTVCTQRKNRVFSLTWPASMQISWNKRKRLHKKRVQLPEDWFGTPTWPPFHCFQGHRYGRCDVM